MFWRLSTVVNIFLYYVEDLPSLLIQMLLDLTATSGPYVLVCLLSASSFIYEKDIYISYHVRYITQSSMQIETINIGS